MEMVMQMPNNYVEVCDDEMMYVEGGFRGSVAGVGRNLNYGIIAVSYILGMGSIASGLSKSVRVLVGQVGKRTARRLAKQALSRVTFGICANTLGAIVDTALNYIDWTPGYAIAYAFAHSRFDKHRGDMYVDF